ncbi:MAG: ABC transporter ATP-binding protein [Candidatus Bathyarchaeia archaeon]
MSNVWLDVKNVTKVFRIGGIYFGERLTAVDNVSLRFVDGEKVFLSIVGESGSGKTTLAKMILGIVEPTSGDILYNGKSIFKLNKSEKKKFRKDVQPIFQNPYESFNPLRKVDEYLYSTLLGYNPIDRKDANNILETVLNMVGLDLERVKGKYPHEFSGGELQRIAIARALTTNPRLLIADEPVSMIDATLRMSILNIFFELKDRFSTSIVYITHDLATAYYISDYIMIMYRGSVVEYGEVKEVLEDPLHPYTRILIESIPKPNPKLRWKEEIKLSGLEVKEFEALGCKFSNRCPCAKDRCFKERPPEITLDGRKVYCWIYYIDK